MWPAGAVLKRADLPELETSSSGGGGIIKRSLRFRESAAQDLGEDDGVVVLGVLGGIDEGERAVPRPPAKLDEQRAMAAELLDIAAAKLIEATRLVREPLPPNGGSSLCAASPMRG